VCNLSIKLYHIYACYKKIMLYHVVYSVRFYPQFHVTAVGLRTYYLRILGSACTRIRSKSYGRSKWQQVAYSQDRSVDYSVSSSTEQIYLHQSHLSFWKHEFVFLFHQIISTLLTGTFLTPYPTSHPWLQTSLWFPVSDGSAEVQYTHTVWNNVFVCLTVDNTQCTALCSSL